MGMEQGNAPTLGADGQQQAVGRQRSQLFKAAGQPADRWMVQQRGERWHFAENPLQLGKKRDGGKGLAAKLEEVVLDAQAVDVENRFPDFCQPAFALACRGDMGIQRSEMLALETRGKLSDISVIHCRMCDPSLALALPTPILAWVFASANANNPVVTP